MLSREEPKRHFIICQQYFHFLAGHRIIVKPGFLFNKGIMKKKIHRSDNDAYLILNLLLERSWLLRDLEVPTSFKLRNTLLLLCISFSSQKLYSPLYTNISVHLHYSLFRCRGCTVTQLSLLFYSHLNVNKLALVCCDFLSFYNAILQKYANGHSSCYSSETQYLLKCAKRI